MIQRVTSLAIMLVCTIALAQTKPSDDDPWHKIKSASASAKNKPTAVKFKVTTLKWRLTIKSTEVEAEPGHGNASPNIRIELMTESLRDVDDQPINWTQVMILCDGKPGDSGAKVFDNGLDKNGAPKWFQLVITGHRAKYDVIVEDQSADDSTTSSKSKKKKKTDK